MGMQLVAVHNLSTRCPSHWTVNLAWKGSERTRREWFCSFLLQTGEVFASRSEKKENFKGCMGPPAVSGRLLPQEKNLTEKWNWKTFAKITHNTKIYSLKCGETKFNCSAGEKKSENKNIVIAPCWWVAGQRVNPASLQKTEKHKTLVLVIYLTFWNMMTSRYWTLKMTCLVISPVAVWPVAETLVY